MTLLICMLGLVELSPACIMCGALTLVRKVNSALKENKTTFTNKKVISKSLNFIKMCLLCKIGINTPICPYLHVTFNLIHTHNV